MSTTTAVAGHHTTATHIATMAALEASTIAMSFRDSDNPEDLLASIADLNGAADLARWALRDFDGRLPEPGRRILAAIRQVDDEDLARALADPETHDGDLAYARLAVEMDDEALAIAFAAEWNVGRASAEGDTASRSGV